MCNDTDTRVIERNRPTGKRHRFNPVPLCIVIFIVVATIIAAGIVKKVAKAGKPGGMEAAHASRYPERVTAAPVPVKAPPKLNHVIFRLGGDEIFRFTHEDAGEGLRYSFEVREGGL